MAHVGHIFVPMMFLAVPAQLVASLTFLLMALTIVMPAFFQAFVECPA